MECRTKTWIATPRTASNASACSDMSSTTMVASPRSSVDQSDFEEPKFKDCDWKADYLGTGSSISVDSQQENDTLPSNTKSSGPAIQVPKRAQTPRPRTSSLQCSRLDALQSDNNKIESPRSTSMPSVAESSRSYYASCRITKTLPEVPRVTNEMRYHYAAPHPHPPRLVLHRTPTGATSMSSASTHTANSSTSTLVDDARPPRTREPSHGRKEELRAPPNFSRPPGPPPTEKLPQLPQAPQAVSGNRRLARIYS